VRGEPAARPTATSRGKEREEEGETEMGGTRGREGGGGGGGRGGARPSPLLRRSPLAPSPVASGERGRGSDTGGSEEREEGGRIWNEKLKLLYI
jgi:hypothetical protein